MRKDGGPRVHPVGPVLPNGRLYVFVVAESPKRTDLERDGRYALHSSVPQTDESFYCTGQAVRIPDPASRATVMAAAKHHVQADETLFQLTIDHALHTTWLDWGTPTMRPQHVRWHGGQVHADAARVCERHQPARGCRAGGLSCSA
ncbi:MAG: hypothetical protein RLZZ387_608 [Chloroflexota bacterium]